eukprot:Hpha_TRINITY_DN14755_c0_g2::TRINITY_DN14755_c0_g2_i2::g.102819::m.102819
MSDLHAKEGISFVCLAFVAPSANPKGVWEESKDRACKKKKDPNSGGGGERRIPSFFGVESGPLGYGVSCRLHLLMGVVLLLLPRISCSGGFCDRPTPPPQIYHFFSPLLP